MNTFVQKLPLAYSVMKLHLLETPIQEQMKIETTAEIISPLKYSRPFSNKPDYLKLSGF